MQTATLGQLPNLAKAFDLLSISIDLENIRPNSEEAIAILEGLKRHKLLHTVRSIQEQAKVDYEHMEWVVGKELLQKIVNYK